MEDVLRDLTTDGTQVAVNRMQQEVCRVQDGGKGWMRVGIFSFTVFEWSFHSLRIKMVDLFNGMSFDAATS